jgi:hypothetical protein
MSVMERGHHDLYLSLLRPLLRFIWPPVEITTMSMKVVPSPNYAFHGAMALIQLLQG